MSACVMEYSDRLRTRNSDPAAHFRSNPTIISVDSKKREMIGNFKQAGSR
jgi:hypothetical protein